MSVGVYLDSVKGYGKTQCSVEGTLPWVCVLESREGELAGMYSILSILDCEVLDTLTSLL